MFPSWKVFRVKLVQASSLKFRSKTSSRVSGRLIVPTRMGCGRLPLSSIMSYLCSRIANISFISAAAKKRPGLNAISNKSQPNLAGSQSLHEVFLAYHACLPCPKAWKFTSVDTSVLRLCGPCSLTLLKRKPSNSSGRSYASDVLCM